MKIVSNKTFREKCIKAGVKYSDKLWNSYIDRCWFMMMMGEKLEPIPLDKEKK